jgi:hypothetical protein
MKLRLASAALVLSERAALDFSDHKEGKPSVTIEPKRGDVMLWILRLIARTTLGLTVVLASVWCALALWYRLPVPEGVRAAIALLFLLLGVATIFASVGRHRLAAPLAFAIAVCSTAVWWSTIRPRDNADWAPDVARQVTGSVEGDRLTLTNVRDFEWHDAQNATERWVTRSYDLGKLRTLDLFMSYWAGPEMAHVILSFGFEGDKYLADRGPAEAGRRILADRRSLQEQSSHHRRGGRARCRSRAIEPSWRGRADLSPERIA